MARGGGPSFLSPMVSRIIKTEHIVVMETVGNYLEVKLINHGRRVVLLSMSKMFKISLNGL